MKLMSMESSRALRIIQKAMPVTVSFQDDHTLFYGDAKGSWLYTHNHLLMHFHTFYEVNEVIQLTSDLLTFKQEFRPSGLPYFKDPSGIHYFWVYECVSK